MALVQPLAQRARWLLHSVRKVMWVSMASGGWLWGLLVWPWILEGLWQVGVGVVLLGALLVPAGFLWLVQAGLRDVIQLPSRLRQTYDSGREHAVALYETAREGRVVPARNRVWRLGRTIWDMRGLLLDGKEELIRYGLMVRFVNPISLLLLLAALAATGVLVVGAAFGTLVVLIF